MSVGLQTGINDRRQRLLKNSNEAGFRFVTPASGRLLELELAGGAKAVQTATQAPAEFFNSLGILPAPNDSVHDAGREAGEH